MVPAQQSRIIVSQVGFMAPEVANAQYKQDYASPASDLFSLGVGYINYECTKLLEIGFERHIIDPS